MNQNDLERLSSVVQNLTRKETDFNYDDSTTTKSRNKLIDVVTKRLSFSNLLWCFRRAVIWFLCGIAVGVAGLAWFLPESNFGWLLVGLICGLSVVPVLWFGFNKFK